MSSTDARWRNELLLACKIFVKLKEAILMIKKIIIVMLLQRLTLKRQDPPSLSLTYLKFGPTIPRPPSSLDY